MKISEPRVSIKVTVSDMSFNEAAEVGMIVAKYGTDVRVIVEDQKRGTIGLEFASVLAYIDFTGTKQRD